MIYKVVLQQSDEGYAIHCPGPPRLLVSRSDGGRGSRQHPRGHSGLSRGHDRLDGGRGGTRSRGDCVSAQDLSRSCDCRRGSEKLTPSVPQPIGWPQSRGPRVQSSRSQEAGPGGRRTHSLRPTPLPPESRSTGAPALSPERYGWRSGPFASGRSDPTPDAGSRYHHPPRSLPRCCGGGEPVTIAEGCARGVSPRRLSASLQRGMPCRISTRFREESTQRSSLLG